MFTILRYTRTPLFDSYLVFLHPFILLLSGYLIYKLMKINKIAGVILLLVLITGSLIRDIPEMKGGYNYSYDTAYRFAQRLKQKFPNKHFVIYDKSINVKDKSFPLVLYLDSLGMLDKSGYKIGLTLELVEHKILYPRVLGEPGDYVLFDINGIETHELKADNWSIVTPEEVYRSTEEWYTKK